MAETPIHEINKGHCDLSWGTFQNVGYPINDINHMWGGELWQVGKTSSLTVEMAENTRR